MTVHYLDDIASAVRIILDQNMVSQPLALEGDVDTLSLDEIIKSKVCEAVKRVHSEAPVYLLDGGHDFGDAIYWKEQCSGWVLLPEDFMRFVVFEMDDWERPVYFPISMDDAEYALQSSRFKGLRGNSQKPVCAIGIRPEGRVLEFYSCKSTDARVRRAVYLPYPRVDGFDGIAVCDRCYDGILYMTAALTAMSFGDSDKGNVLLELSKSVLI